MASEGRSRRRSGRCYEVLPGGRAPAGLTLEQHRDLEGRERQPWSRRILLALVALFCAAALLNGFGQARYVDTVAGNGAELEVEAPPRVRGGIYYEMRFEVRAERELRDAILVLGSGWFEGITVNTVVPGPIGEASRNGDVLVPASGAYRRVNGTSSGCRPRSTRPRSRGGT